MEAINNKIWYKIWGYITSLSPLATPMHHTPSILHLIKIEYSIEINFLLRNYLTDFTGAPL